MERSYQRAKSQVQNERLNEWEKDESDENEDGEDDELPSVIGGESEGNCLWRGSQRSVGSSFHRQSAAYRKERLVILKRAKSPRHVPLSLVRQPENGLRLWVRPATKILATPMSLPSLLTSDSIINYKALVYYCVSRFMYT